MCKIYTDGSCYGNPGPGGWAVILKEKDYKQTITGFEKLSSNNRMELTAVINGLAAAPRYSNVDLFTDSQYVYDAIISGRILVWKSNGWKRIKTGEPIANKDLWMLLIEITKKNRLRVSYHKLKAHKGHMLNEQVDTLARKTAKQEIEPYCIFKKDGNRYRIEKYNPIKDVIDATHIDKEIALR